MEKRRREQTAYEHVTHTFEPVFDKDSEILILGSLPSVKSREQNFYYGHPQNRFWKMMAEIYREPVPETMEEKRRILLRRHVALWDVISSCDIVGSSDSTIKNVVPNDIRGILEKSAVGKICFNGKKAYELFMRYCGLPESAAPKAYELVPLPSTSPANAAFGMERLVRAWRVHMPGV